MQKFGTDPALSRPSRLRFVFSEKVVSLGLSANATYEEVARRLGKFSRRRYGNTVAIHVTFNPASHAAGLR
jgi:hypothetical protein